MEQSSRINIRRKLVAFVAVFLILILGIFAFSELKDFTSEQETIEPPKLQVETPKTETKKVIKNETSLSIPYTVQAPLANWNIHEESCEEAALLMYHYYLAGKSTPTSVIPKEIANKELVDMVTWQKTHYGKESDLDMTALGQLAKDYYGYDFEVKKNVTEIEIKTALSDGHPIIFPVMTQSLHNPNYRPNSVYHVVLVKGYDATGVITNDAGVKEGESWHYPWATVWEAMDAQTPKMKQGRDILILTK